MKRRSSEKENEESASPRSAKGDRESTSNATSERTASLQRAVGNQAVQRLVEDGRLQPKLSVSQPNDASEREADRVAEAVMRMPAGPVSVGRTASTDAARSVGRSGSVPAVQRQPAGGGSEFDTYTVQSGDSLWAIANRFEVEGGHQRIAEMNDMAVDDVLRPGDELKLPAGSIQGGGSGGGSESAGGGGGESGGGGSGGSGSSSGTETYVVQRGESLSDLSEKHGVPVSALKQANREKLRTWDGVQGFVAGATIVVPAGSSSGGQTSESAEEVPDWQEIRESWAQFAEELGSGGTWILDHVLGDDRGGAGESGGETQSEPEWVRIARGETGQKEVSGSEHNPRVIEYHETSNVSNRQEITDEIPWCGSFVNWVMGRAGYSGPDQSAWSQAWKNWGRQLSDPVYGAIVVFHWGDGRGHVGFVVGKSGSSIQVLGGNQSDQVKESTYSTGSVVAYVVPNDYDESAYSRTLGEDVGEVSGGGLESTR